MSNNINIVIGNCVDHMRTLPDNSIPMVITSPPYDNNRVYDNGSSLDINSIVTELYRIVTKLGVVIWNVSDQVIKGAKTGSSFRQCVSFMNAGFSLQDTMIYAKKNYIPLEHAKRYGQQFEFVFCFSKGNKVRVFNPIKIPCVDAGKTRKYTDKSGKNVEGRGRQTSYSNWTTKSSKNHPNIFYYATGQKSKYLNGKHPAPFPLQLAIDQISTWSVEGDVIYDPFCGSGTAGEAAISLNRRFLGCDISESYVAMASDRLSNMMNDKKEKPCQTT